MHHSTFEYDSFADLIDSYERLKGETILPAFALHHGLTISLYYRDPEGNHVDLKNNDLDEGGKSGDWVRNSPDFKANPISTFFDAQKIAQAYAAGRNLSRCRPPSAPANSCPRQLPISAYSCTPYPYNQVGNHRASCGKANISPISRNGAIRNGRIPR